MVGAARFTLSLSLSFARSLFATLLELFGREESQGRVPANFSW